VRPPIEDMPPGIATWASDYEASVAARFARLVELLRPLPRDDVTLETRIRAGGVAECLRDAAEETGATLVAVGTRGAGWAERLFVGGVAAGTLRSAGRSVLLVPPPGAAEQVRLELGVTRHVVLERAVDWGAALDALTRRNAGRRARLEVGGRDATNPVVQADRCRFLGAAYDPHDGRVELMLGGDAHDGGHLTHGIAHVRAVEIVAEGAGRDHALLVEDERGEAVLTFLD
jgi:hypothetical protein